MRKIFILVLGGMLLGGCAAVTRTADAVAFQHRAARSPDYAQLAPETQARLAHGEVRFGDTPEMVRLARGAPDRVERTERGERWIYEAYLRGGESSASDLGPPNYHAGQPTLIRAIAFRGGAVVGIVERQ
jgi:hypothetical protein